MYGNPVLCPVHEHTRESFAVTYDSIGLLSAKSVYAVHVITTTVVLYGYCI
jgi:hypothetical protein